MLRYVFVFIIVFIISKTAFSADVMVNLTKGQAERTITFLQGKKSVLIRNGNIFNYLRVNKLEMKHGVAKTSTLDKFSILHQDGDDYYIEINNQAIDLENVYLQNRGNTSKWSRLGSKINPNFYKNRVNETYYVYKNKEKIPASLRKNLKFAGFIKTPKVSGNNSMTLEEESDDREFNNAEVFKPLRQVD